MTPSSGGPLTHLDAPIRVGDWSGQDFALSPDGSTLYVTAYESSDVTVVDTRTREIRAVIPVIGATAITTSPDGGMIYVTNTYSDSVFFIDARTNEVVREVEAAGNLSSIAVSPDGKLLYVVDSFYSPTSPRGHVMILETESGDPLPSIEVGIQPGGIVVAADGRVYVANADGFITVIDLTTLGWVRSAIEIDGRPGSLAISPDGSTIYVVEEYSGSILVIDATTYDVIEAMELRGYPPSGVTASPDGRTIYATSAYYFWTIDAATLSIDAQLQLHEGGGGLKVAPDGRSAYVLTGTTVTIATPPVAPDVPEYLSLSPSSEYVYLYWGAPPSDGGSPITGYVVESSDNDGATWTTQPHAGTAPYQTVSGLANGRPYVFRVSAVNSVGVGQPRVSSSVVPADVPGPPLELKASISGSRATLTWSAPQNDGGDPVTGYVLAYRAVADASWQDGPQTDANTRTATIVGLIDGKAYEFSVRARNSVGSGPEYVITAGWGSSGSVTFSDVPSSSQFADEISWLASSGVTTGYPDGSFRPLGTVNRDAMAAFLYRFAGSPAFAPPAVSPFTDVSTSNQFYKEIAWLADTGITTGCPDGGFHPLGTVNRDAMAAFLYRFAESPSFTAPAVSPFIDVATSSQFFKEITWLADTGVTTGYPDGGFHPLGTVNRDAMAAFLYRFDNREG